VIVRYENWGAWVKLESLPALVALDREGVLALGLDGKETWTEGPEASHTPNASAPIEVHLAVTAKCAAGCEGCYLDARPDGLEPSLDTLLERLDALRDAGVFTVAFGGGEPTTREDIGELAKEAVRRGITPVLTTSGLGMTQEKARRLSAFAQVNVSYDGVGDDYRAVRGFDGARAAENAISMLSLEGVRVGVNVVLTRDTFPRVRETLRRARSLGAKEAQLLRYKPAGRAATLDYMARRLTPDQADGVGPLLRSLVAEHASLAGDAAEASTGSVTNSGGGTFAIRIDCAMVAFLSADEELAVLPERLSRFGIFGCEGAQALAAVKVDGAVSPCSFGSSTSLVARDLATGMGHDPEIARWRAYPLAPPEPCASCSLRAVCKGGCKVVASFLLGRMEPDPECPRVRAFRGEPRERRV
jgi:radical SAM protein with 4Fe4S-binding SPASM domain